MQVLPSYRNTGTWWINSSFEEISFLVLWYRIKCDLLQIQKIIVTVYNFLSCLRTYSRLWKQRCDFFSEKGKPRCKNCTSTKKYTKKFLPFFEKGYLTRATIACIKGQNLIGANVKITSSMNYFLRNEI